MRKSKTIKRKGSGGYKKIPCMNHDPENSKWGQYAPDLSGCTEVVEVPVETSKVLCYRCTSRSANQAKIK
jgi:hypothetical protein